MLDGQSIHVSYVDSDFTNKEIEDGNIMSKLVIEDGLSICKKCGAAELDLETFPSCELYRDSLSIKMYLHSFSTRRY